MILQSIAPEARSSATDYVADVTDVNKTEVRQCPMPCLPDALFARCPVCPMPNAQCPCFPKKCGNSLPLPTAPVCRSFERRTLKITIALLLINVNTIGKIFQ
ncbi:hypothetical protein QUB12_10055 [Microcoleus sp. B7-D4]